MKKYVLKDSNNWYWMLHQDKKDISPCLTNIEGAMKYTKEEAKYVFDNFKDVWKRSKIRAYKIELSLGNPISICQ
jgi:hypothetical protein